MKAIPSILIFVALGATGCSSHSVPSLSATTSANGVTHRDVRPLGGSVPNVYVLTLRPVAGGCSFESFLGSATGNVAPSTYGWQARTSGRSCYGIALDYLGFVYGGGADGANHADVNVFAPSSQGRVMPSRVIDGPDTGIDQNDVPLVVAVDIYGYLYVCDTSPIGTHKVLEYGIGAGGDAIPIRTIAGPNTGLTGYSCLSAAVGTDGNGLLYIPVYDAASGHSHINVYTGDETGDVPPFATITPTQGDGIINSIAVDRNQNVYVDTYRGSQHCIDEFPANTWGPVGPINTIIGPHTLLGDRQIAVDGAGRIYAANYDRRSVMIFAAGATGDAAPVQIIHGNLTRVGGANGIALY